MITASVMAELNVAIFMYKINQKIAPNIFLARSQKPSHSYPTRLSEYNYLKPIHNIKRSKYSISVRGPYIWHSFLSPKERQITTMYKFKATTTSKLLFLENELVFFKRKLFICVRLYDKLLRLQFWYNRLLGFDDKTSLVFCKSVFLLQDILFSWYM